MTITLPLYHPRDMKRIRTANFKDALYTILREYDNRSLKLMISGGSLLETLENQSYRSLVTDKWEIYYADERCDQKHLNYKDSEKFLSLLKSRNYRIDTASCSDNSSGKDNSPTGVEEYKGILKDKKMDICLLGVGENGHICSLWPNSEELHSRETVIKTRVPAAVSPDRVTVTLHFLNNFVSACYFVIPPKNGIPKLVAEPHESIRNGLTIDYTVILPEI